MGQEKAEDGWRTIATSQPSTGVLETIWPMETTPVVTTPVETGPKENEFGFRLSTSTPDSGWAWDVPRVKFMLTSGQELVPGGTSGCIAIESGHVPVAGYGVQSAFTDGKLWWGGRKDSSDLFFIGIECDSPQQVASIQLQQLDGNHHVTNLDVQEKAEDGWRTIATSQPSTGVLETIWPMETTPVETTPVETGPKEK